MADTTRQRRRTIRLSKGDNEDPLARAVHDRDARAWLRRNRGALAAYNRQVEKHGVFSEGLRSF